MKNTLRPVLVLLGLSGCGIFGHPDYAPLEVVSHVDLQKYAGRWYEIASLPVSQQEGCTCTTAEYLPGEEGVITVINTCRKGAELDKVEGKAFVVPNSGNAKLRVQFFWPFRGDYWVLDLANDYSYAVVGVPSRKYCWILSRSASMNAETLKTLIDRLRVNGFDVDRLQYTSHPCSPGVL